MANCQYKYYNNHLYLPDLPPNSTLPLGQQGHGGTRQNSGCSAPLQWKSSARSDVSTVRQAGCHLGPCSVQWAWRWKSREGSRFGEGSHPSDV